MDVGQYLEIFIDESSEHIQTLSDCIMTLEQEPDNKDTINEVFRAAHSLKGMAGTMGYKRMQNLTHDMENVFSEVRNGSIKVNAAIIDVVFQCLDALEEYLANIQESADEGTNENEPIIKALNDILKGESGAGAPKAEDKKEDKKLERWERIIYEAAKQSKRNLVPVVNTPLSFNSIIENTGEFDLFIVPVNFLNACDINLACNPT